MKHVAPFKMCINQMEWKGKWVGMTKKYMYTPSNLFDNIREIFMKKLCGLNYVDLDRHILEL